MPDIYEATKALEKGHFKTQCFETAAEAAKAILDLIPENATVGAGGSVTLAQLGILEALHARGNTVFSADLAAKLNMDADLARKQSTAADYYLSSSNAVTLTGELVNIDGRGNRVAGMFYGPDTVIVVAGKNKITRNQTQAISRIKKVACPLNAKRLKKNTPCAKTGVCGNCDSDDRICRITVIMDYVPRGKTIHVFLVNEDLGY
jgi:hypothetical protein